MPSNLNKADDLGIEQRPVKKITKHEEAISEIQVANIDPELVAKNGDVRRLF